MELDKVWEWEKRKLGCRISPVTGNPAEADLREQLADLAGVPLQELLSDMQAERKKKKDHKQASNNFIEDKKFKEILQRSHVLGATEIALKELQEENKSDPKSQKNIKKRYCVNVFKSPPRRVMLELLRERAKPMIIPDQEEGKINTTKLEKKLAKQRAARMAAKDEAAKDEKAQKLANDANFSNGRSTMSTVLPSYEGDRFGTSGEYMEGMLYLSRMPVAASRAKGGKRMKVKDAFAWDNENTTANAESDGNDNTTGNIIGLLEDASASDAAASAEEMSSKLYCAAALCNWSRNPSNAQRLANEDAVKAIIQLSQETMPRIAMYCAGALRYMSEHLILATKMIEEKVILTILDMIASTTEEFIYANVTICLLNLTRVTGRESQLVEDGIVNAFTNIITERPELHGPCCRGLYNLTCVDTAYAMMDRLIRALVALSGGGTSTVKHICAAALCNLADLRQVRLRMVEEGTISALKELTRGAETRTRRVCAVILQNLSSNKSCRVEMVTRNCVQIAYGLSSDQDPVILRCIGLTLSRLASEPGNSNRIINENGIAALCNIAVKYPTIPGISQPAAMAFQMLSSRPGIKSAIVKDSSGASVAAIASLLRLSTDLSTLQFALLALCNLLSVADNHLPIVQQGMVGTLMHLCTQENETMKDYCALAMFNMSCEDDSRKHVVNAGAVSSVISLSRHKSIATKRRCAATLCNLSSYETGLTRMVADGVIPALVELLEADDVETVRYGCAALCRLCSTVENGRMILESGAVPLVVQRAIEGDIVTKQFCGAVLSSLSFYESCRATLCDIGVFSAIRALSMLNDDTTRQRCLIAFANLSCDDTIQTMMVEQGVVGIISELANSYQEMNQICCARALCNLACSNDSRLRVAKEGGMQALMMISMVRSVDIQTKLLCIRAMDNLLDDHTISYLLSEGILGAVSNLCKVNDVQVMNLSAKLFNHLTTYTQGRNQFVDRPTSLAAMFGLFEVDDIESKMICARSTCNMIICETSTRKAIEQGALVVIENGVQLEDSEASLHCLQATFSAALNKEYRLRIAKSTLPLVLCQVALGCLGDRLEYCLNIISLIAWHEDSRQYLQSCEFIELMMKLVEMNPLAVASHSVAQTLCYASIGYTDQKAVLDHGMEACIQKFCETNDEVVIDCASALLTNLFTDERCVPLLAKASTIAILNHICAVCTSPVTMHNVAVVLLAFSKTPDVRVKILSPDVVDLLDTVTVNVKCAELVAASLAAFCLDSRCRPTFANATIALLTVRILEFNPPEDTQSNVVAAIYALSKIPSCREELMVAAVDRILLKLSQGDSAKVKASCSQALKNLSSDATETIEEGAISALIAMSLEGKNRSKGPEEADFPIIQCLNYKTYGPPQSASLTFKEKAEYWKEDSERAKGGPAGRGPSPPAPPDVSMESATAPPSSLAEDLEPAVESEGRTKMAFAKMLVPTELRDSYLFTDRDFDVQDDASDANSTNQMSPEQGLDKENSTFEADGETPHVGVSVVTSESASVSSEQSPANSIQSKGSRGSYHRGSSSQRRSTRESEAPELESPKAVRRKKKQDDMKTITVSEQAAQLKLFS